MSSEQESVVEIASECITLSSGDEEDLSRSIIVVADIPVKIEPEEKKSNFGEPPVEDASPDLIPLEIKVFPSSILNMNKKFPKEDTIADKPQLLHECQDCDKTYNNAGSLRTHIYRNHREKVKRVKFASKLDFHCVECGEGFDTKEGILEHQLQHSKKKSTDCILCGLKFQRANYLRMHMRGSVHKEMEKKVKNKLVEKSGESVPTQETVLEQPPTNAKPSPPAPPPPSEESPPSSEKVEIPKETFSETGTATPQESPTASESQKPLVSSPPPPPAYQPPSPPAYQTSAPTDMSRYHPPGNQFSSFPTLAVGGPAPVLFYGYMIPMPGNNSNSSNTYPTIQNFPSSASLPSSARGGQVPHQYQYYSQPLSYQQGMHQAQTSAQGSPFFAQNNFPFSEIKLSSTPQNLSVSCPFCKDQFSSEIQLHTHIRSVHP